MGRRCDEQTRGVYNVVLATADDIISDLEKRLSALELQEPKYKGL